MRPKTPVCGGKTFKLWNLGKLERHFLGVGNDT